jgi:pyruvate formate lyase activating enzyme
MRIGGLTKSSLIDYPGKIAAVLHLAGCNLRCPFCHNPELVLPSCFQEPVPVAEVMAFLERRRERLDGVVVSGGEPTIHDDLPELIANIKALGFALKLDTNGMHPEMLRCLLSDGLLDYIAMDVKAPLKTYASACGKTVPVEKLRTSIWLIKNSGVRHEFRTTVVPGLHTVRELKAIADDIHGAECYAVQDFVSDRPLNPGLRGRPTFAPKPLRDLRRYVERRVQRYEIRTNDDAQAMPSGRHALPAMAEAF